MKYEWRKQEKALYTAKEPTLLTVPPQRFVMLDGRGNPNGPDFSARVSALYTLAYAVKNAYKAAAKTAQPPFDDYTVYPLEGVWRLGEDADAANNIACPSEGTDGKTNAPSHLAGGLGTDDAAPQTAGQAALNKKALVYTIMLCQPAFVDEALIAQALARVQRTKPSPFGEQIRVETVRQGLCVQLLHTGPYDTEPASFARMDAFAAAQGYKRREDCHREIYLSVPKGGQEQNRKTLLRYRVE